MGSATEPDLPAGFLDALKAMGLEGTMHCLQYGGPFRFEVEMFKRDPHSQIVGFEVSSASKTMRGDAFRQVK